MNYIIEYIKDIYGNNYLGIVFSKSEVSKYLEKMKEFLSEEDYSKFTKNQSLRDGDKYHMTVINVMEYNKLFKHLPDFQERLDVILDLNISDLQLKGLGRANKMGDTTYFVVADSPTLDEIRSSLGLEEKDFHITLGFNTKDVFGVRKNEVLKSKTKIQILNDQYLEEYGAAWIKNISNIKEEFKDVPDDKIEFLSMTDTHLKYKIDNYTLTIGYINDEMRVLTIS